MTKSCHLRSARRSPDLGRLRVRALFRHDKRANLCVRPKSALPGPPASASRSPREPSGEHLARALQSPNCLLGPLRRAQAPRTQAFLSRRHTLPLPLLVSWGHSTVIFSGPRHLNVLRVQPHASSATIRAIFSAPQHKMRRSS